MVSVILHRKGVQIRGIRVAGIRTRLHRLKANKVVVTKNKRVQMTENRENQVEQRSLNGLIKIAPPRNIPKPPKGNSQSSEGSKEKKRWFHKAPKRSLPLQVTWVVLSEKQIMILCFSSGVLDASERDSNRKTRWNSTINQQDRNSASSSSECSPNSTLRKTKSRNEGTVLLRFAGDINMLVTPLMLEALQRCVTITIWTQSVG